MSQTSPLPVYDSSRRGFKPWVELREAFHYRNAIVHLVRRDIVSRYKRSFLGILWTMLNPLGMMLVLAVVFSNVMKAGPTFAPYLLSGLIGFQFFSQTSNAVLAGFRWGVGLFPKIYIPRSVFGISAIGTGLVNFVLSILPLVVTELVTGVTIRWTVLFLPVPMLLLACFSLGVGLLLATVGISFPDVSDMYQILLVAWMYLTPIIYPEERLPDALKVLIPRFNPMYWLIKLFRLSVFDGRMPTWQEFLTPLIIAVTTLLFGWWVFSRKVDEFAYKT